MNPKTMSFVMAALYMSACAAPALNTKPEDTSDSEHNPSDAELGRRLRAMHAKCVSYQGLTLNEASRRAMEEWKALRGASARFDECVALFSSDESEKRPPPESAEQPTGVPREEDPNLAAPPRLEELESKIAALRARVLESRERLSRLRDEVIARARCVEEFNIEEIYFESWFCAHINEVVSR